MPNGEKDDTNKSQTTEQPEKENTQNKAGKVENNIRTADAKSQLAEEEDD